VLLILLRIVQGIAVGGEWGGAVLMAGEHAPKGRRNFFASFAQLGSPAGLILSLLAFSAVTRHNEAEDVLPEDVRQGTDVLLNAVLARAVKTE